MFDIPERYKNVSPIMLSNNMLRFGEIRSLFYNSDLSKLSDFCVIINVHSDAPLGTYIVHKKWVDDPFMKSDDFDVCFTIDEYNKVKSSQTLTDDYDFIDELEKFKDKNTGLYTWYRNPDNRRHLYSKTKWTVITYRNKPIALVSDTDSWRIPNQMEISEEEERKYRSFRVPSLEEGIDYLKVYNSLL